MPKIPCRVSLKVPSMAYFGAFARYIFINPAMKIGRQIKNNFLKFLILNFLNLQGKYFRKGLFCIKTKIIETTVAIKVASTKFLENKRIITKIINDIVNRIV